MTIKAVIFDLDGTITRPYLDFDLVRKEIGLDKNCGPILETIGKMPPDQRAYAEAILHSHEKKAVEESTLNPGAEKTLKTLARKDIAIGILTRNTRKNAVAVMQKHRLAYDAIVAREDGPVKPDAFGVLQLCRAFNVEPCETLMVGDYLFDMQAANAAGAHAVLLRNIPQAQQYAEYARFVIDNLDELLKIIDNPGE
ncbi:MAG: HAD-IA family hydrolase [Planctomycetota bacterium]